eukprot:TRINITY_DN21101_c0_g1_i1.p1 TRINITY_DN21101_c0_g1~~TRINITY_DN21101_c0_g1_i1.p1  ORF type:complete len:211 (+),score=15.00 TRINITY_DN21101_c0_g1_i1:1203-1835(+)
MRLPVGKCPPSFEGIASSVSVQEANAARAAFNEGSFSTCSMGPAEGKSTLVSQRHRFFDTVNSAREARVHSHVSPMLEGADSCSSSTLVLFFHGHCFFSQWQTRVLRQEWPRLYGRIILSPWILRLHSTITHHLYSGTLIPVPSSIAFNGNVHGSRAAHGGPRISPVPTGANSILSAKALLFFCPCSNRPRNNNKVEPGGNPPLVLADGG